MCVIERLLIKKNKKSLYFTFLNSEGFVNEYKVDIFVAIL